jgi:hypothetical protein
LTAIEPRPAGRPSRVSASAAEQIRTLQERVQELEQALHEAQVREEIALVLPRVGRPASAGTTAAVDGEGKNTARQRVTIRKPR